jgi:hypothetical protein
MYMGRDNYVLLFIHETGSHMKNEGIYGESEGVISNWDKLILYLFIHYLFCNRFVTTCVTCTTGCSGVFSLLYCLALLSYILLLLCSNSPGFRQSPQLGVDTLHCSPLCAYHDDQLHPGLPYFVILFPVSAELCCYIGGDQVDSMLAPPGIITVCTSKAIVAVDMADMTKIQ